jgi:hypothetical protein
MHRANLERVDEFQPDYRHAVVDAFDWETENHAQTIVRREQNAFQSQILDDLLLHAERWNELHFLVQLPPFIGCANKKVPSPCTVELNGKKA